jgi:hypothetical protein
MKPHWLTTIDAFDTKCVDGRHHVLQNPRGEFGFCVHGLTIVPYDGFVFDMASVPRWAWSLFPPDGDGPKAMYGPAACIHDFLYIYQRIGSVRINRAFADDVFYSAMKAAGVSKWRRDLMFWAVRVGGQSAWSKHK